MKPLPLDKIGVIGAIFAAGLAPCCFPLLGVIGSALGLTFLESYAPQIDILVQLLVTIAFLGSVFAFRTHRSISPLIVSTIGTGFVFYHYYGEWNPQIVYVGFALLVISGIWNTLKIKKNRMTACKKAFLRKSVITCPKCGFEKEEAMPTDSCQFFWECPSCKTLLKPKKGDCCVFCSYGSVPCPPIQMEGSCCP